MTYSMSDITPAYAEALEAHGLTQDEGLRILNILERKPLPLEVGLFSAMWSEHCSYKSSRIHLGKLPTEGPQVAIGPGENAGAVKLNNGVLAVFKMESHNHPSYIEPFQGAATGVGGILRDVFTMGARPIANLNSIRFGSTEHPKTPHLLLGVVGGIAFYGNCMGVPTVAGETEFHAGYDDNILVNAMTVGIAKEDGIFLGAAEGIGNPVFYVGSRTGRDGIHGATMASASFDDEAEAKRPTVQVGDPFTEKKLLEACLELFKEDVVVGIQDMGAAGLTSSTFEMADRAGKGIRIDLDQVPMREEGMVPYELMLSESQERMLVVARKGSEASLQRIFEKWDLACAHIGEVTDSGQVELFWHGDQVANVPVHKLATGAPKYDRPTRPRPTTHPVPDLLPASPDNPGAMLHSILSDPIAGSRRPVYEQYDHMVQVRTMVRPGGGAAVLRVPEAEGMISVASECAHRACILDPREGARRTVADAARKISATGALPLAITDCLNFGNPEVPEVMWEFVEAIEGLKEGCLALNTPVVSGNVSFYNETRDQSIPPSPTIGMVGWMDNEIQPAPGFVREDGLDLWLVKGAEPSLDGSLWQQYFCGTVGGELSKMDFEMESRVQNFARALVKNKLVAAARNLGSGGLAVSLAKMLFNGEKLIGLKCGAFSSEDGTRRYFGEAPSSMILASTPDHRAEIVDLAKAANVELQALGQTGGQEFNLGDIHLDINRLYGAWNAALNPLMGISND